MVRPLVIDATTTIPGTELEWTAVRSGGPGGQNVNKVASKVELRFDLPGTQALDPTTCERLRVIAGNRLDALGRVLIVSQLTRDQSQNLEDALEKLAVLVRRALERPRRRVATRPSRAANRRRVADKRENSARKQARRGGAEE